MNDYLSSPEAKKEFLAYQLKVKSILERKGYSLRLAAQNKDLWVNLEIKNGVIKEVIGNVQGVLGYSSETLIGKKLSDISPEIQPDGVASQPKISEMLVFNKIIKENSFSWNFLNINKQEIPCMVHFTPSNEEDIVEALVIDQTEQEVSKFAMLKNIERYYTLSSLSPVGIFQADPFGDYIYINDAWFRMTGLKLEQAIGDGWTKAIHPDDLFWVQNSWKHAVLSGTKYQAAFRIIHSSGKESWVMTQANPEIGENGKIQSYVGSVSDITEWKYIEQKLIRSEEKLEKTVAERTRELQHSNKSLERFAYSVSHDLQEPLRMIVSYLQLLEKRVGDRLNDTEKEYFDFATEGATRLKALLDGILKYSRVNTHQKPLDSINMEEVLQQVIKQLDAALKTSDASISFEWLPQVRADASQMNQVFQNLIGNAIKFCTDRLPEIKIKAEEREDEFLFSVADNGIGINEEYKDLVFLIFHRLNARSKFPGSGIGLSICKNIIERHGGEIWFESTLGVGTTFYFTLKK